MFNKIGSFGEEGYGRGNLSFLRFFLFWVGFLGSPCFWAVRGDLLLRDIPKRYTEYFGPIFCDIWFDCIGQ